MLLKHLKDYHHEAISILTKEIANLEVRLRNDAGFVENWEEIRHIAQRKATAYEENKRNKMSKLTNCEQREMRQHLRKKKKEQNRNNCKENKNTVVNIFNVPLSDEEIKFVSWRLSFCPKPSQINKFQVKEGTKQFSRRLRLSEYFYDLDVTNY